MAAATRGVFKPFVQSLYVDLAADPDQPAAPIDLGFRGGRNLVFDFLDALRAGGVNHVIINFKYSTRDASGVLEEIGTQIVPRLEASQPVDGAPHVEREGAGHA